MKTQLIKILSLMFLAPISLAEDSLQDLEVEHFQVKLKPGEPVPTGRVYSDDPSKIKYNKSRSETLPYTVEVRGRCPQAIEKLTAFRLKHNNNVILDIPVSGNNRSLTGNNGKKWEAQQININLPVNSDYLIQACNAKAVQELQNQSHDQVFNSNFQTTAVDSGQQVKVYYHCEGGAWFYDLNYDTAALPIKALCEATGYESILRVTESQLSLNPITGQDGTCKLKISGGFNTSYELYALRSNQSTADLKYRFKYHGAGQSANVAYSQWWEKTANPINGGAFVFNYTDRLPTSISGGKISLEVMINGKLTKSGAKPFSIACVDALPLQQTQIHQLSLAVVADKAELVAVAGQLCPSHALITAELTAGSPINGKMLIIGSSLVDIYPYDFSASAGGVSTRQKRVKLTWATGISNTLTEDGTVAASNELKSQTLSYGLRILNSDNTVAKNLAKSPYKIRCELPGVNPSLVGSATALTTADNTPDLNKQTHAGGLKSDGELVQAKKPLNLLGHELGQTSQQEGKMLIDNDINEASRPSQQKQRNVPPGAVPIPYPTVSSKKVNPQKHAKDANDRFANQQPSHKARTVPLQNATVSSIRSEQLNKRRSARTTLFKGKPGQQCKRGRFPKNAVIKQYGRQYVAKCVNSKVQIKQGSKVQRQWKIGDPVYTPAQKSNTRGKKKGGVRLTDEMPEDFPAGYKKQNQNKSFKR